MKNDIQENLWIEAGETMEGLISFMIKWQKKNDLYKFLIERQEEAKQLTTA